MTTPLYAREPHLQQLGACMSGICALGAAAAPDQAFGMSSGALNATLAQRMELLAPLADSVIRNVISCADNGAVGTLRQVIGVANDDDIIDLGSLPCSTITLTAGEIVTARNGLKLQGPLDDSVVEITTSNQNRLLHHTGAGQIEIQHLKLTEGKYVSATGNAKGGCLYSEGNVRLISTVMNGCGVYVSKASAPPVQASGGAVYAQGSIYALLSTITLNSAFAKNSNVAKGGALVSGFDFVHGYYSTLSSNTAGGVTMGVSFGLGGAVVGDEIFFRSSTIESNHADIAGALFEGSSGVGNGVALVNCTVSGNTSTTAIGAIYSAAKVQLFNSTLAFNSTTSGAAVSVKNAAVTAVSSIIARNSSGSAFVDLYISGASGTLGGDHSLIMSSNLALPGTLTADPRLTPLAYHVGVERRTHALLSSSPAINQGSNLLTLLNDGRGLVREVPTGFPDIGAYERQVLDDEIFYGGFD